MFARAFYLAQINMEPHQTRPIVETSSFRVPSKNHGVGPSQALLFVDNLEFMCSGRSFVQSSMQGRSALFAWHEDILFLPVIVECIYIHFYIMI